MGRFKCNCGQVKCLSELWMEDDINGISIHLRDGKSAMESKVNELFALSDKDAITLARYLIDAVKSHRCHDVDKELGYGDRY